MFWPLFTWSLVHYMGLEQVTDCPLYSSSWFSPTIKQRIYTAFLWQTSSIWSRAGLMLGHYTLLGTCWYMADWLWIIGPHFCDFKTSLSQHDIFVIYWSQICRFCVCEINHMPVESWFWGSGFAYFISMCMSNGFDLFLMKVGSCRISDLYLHSLWEFWNIVECESTVQ